MAKKRKLSNIPNRTHSDRPRPKASSAASKAKQSHPKHQNKQQPKHKQEQHEKPTIPFTPDEDILLIGEGDLSFAASLVQHHKCTSVTATVLEKNREELEGKYPHVGENIEAFHSKEEESGSKDEEGRDSEDEDDGWEDDNDDSDEDGRDKKKKSPPRNNRIFYNIDATKPLPNSLLSSRGPFSTIIFNFPHVGGLSTDINRQVRHNQSLLVSFFTSILSQPPQPSKPFALTPSGSIVITLFEAEPYTLWNIKDLARHAGLAVEKSFRFQAEAYPGYKHARTCGVIEGGGWKGEERRARTYVFRRKGEVGGQMGKKRKKGRESDDEDD